MAALHDDGHLDYDARFDSSIKNTQSFFSYSILVLSHNFSCLSSGLLTIGRNLVDMARKRQQLPIWWDTRWGEAIYHADDEDVWYHDDSVWWRGTKWAKYDYMKSTHKAGLPNAGPMAAEDCLAANIKQNKVFLKSKIRPMSSYIPSSSLERW